MNYGKDDAYHLSEPTVAELQLLVDSGGSMKPKAETINRLHEISSCITSLEKAVDALEGKAGTWARNRLFFYRRYKFKTPIKGFLYWNYSSAPLQKVIICIYWYITCPSAPIFLLIALIMIYY